MEEKKFLEISEPSNRISKDASEEAHCPQLYFILKKIGLYQYTLNNQKVSVQWACLQFYCGLIARNNFIIARDS